MVMRYCFFLFGKNMYVSSDFIRIQVYMYVEFFRKIFRFEYVVIFIIVFYKNIIYMIYDVIQLSLMLIKGSK